MQHYTDHQILLLLIQIHRIINENPIKEFIVEIMNEFRKNVSYFDATELITHLYRIWPETQIPVILTPDILEAYIEIGLDCTDPTFLQVLDFSGDTAIFEKIIKQGAIINESILYLLCQKDASIEHFLRIIDYVYITPENVYLYCANGSRINVLKLLIGKTNVNYQYCLNEANHAYHKYLDERDNQEIIRFLQEKCSSYNFHEENI